MSKFKVEVKTSIKQFEVDIPNVPPPFFDIQSEEWTVQSSPEFDTEQEAEAYIRTLQHLLEGI